MTCLYKENTGHHLFTTVKPLTGYYPDGWPSENTLAVCCGESDRLDCHPLLLVPPTSAVVFGLSFSPPCPDSRVFPRVNWFFSLIEIIPGCGTVYMSFYWDLSENHLICWKLCSWAWLGLIRECISQNDCCSFKRLRFIITRNAF